MKMTEIFERDRPALSFEVFPPKTSSGYETIKDATEKIASLNPSYMSVTYGAGGGTSEYTVSIAANLQKRYKVPVLAHLTCVNSTKQSIKDRLGELKEAGIENVLALRGDNFEESAKASSYKHASELVEEVSKFGGFCIGGACYPEGHTESACRSEDIKNLKIKVDAGCEFLTTQMFFDNNILYNFLYKVRDAGIKVPVVAGIMPVTNAKQIKKITELSQTSLPSRFLHIVDKFGHNPAAMRQAGVAYATEQIIDLFANGVDAVHVYSMNNPQVAKAIQDNLSEIIA